MPVTLNDIARKAGLSVSTVSRVLNNQAKKYRISKAAEKMVLKVAKEMDYRPNQLARGLRLRKTHSVGLIAPDISNPFFAHIIKTIQSEIHKINYALVVCDSDENHELEVEHTNLLYSKGVDGLIVMPVGQRCNHFESLLEKGIPIVFVDRVFDELKANVVVIDNHAGAFEAVEYLIAHGHRRIAIIQGLSDTFTSLGRLYGYLDALKKNGLPVDEKLIVGNDFRIGNGYIETKFLLKSSSPPTALFTTGDLITLGALQALSEESLEVPKDISVVGFDDLESVDYFKCPVTTVSQPKQALGEMAVKLLTDQIQNPGKHEIRKIVLKPTLIVRESVAVLSEPSTVGTSLD